MFLLGLPIMSKRFRYGLSSLVCGLGFWFYLQLPFESKYYGMMVGVVLTMFCFWFGLGIVFTKDFTNRMASIILPVLFYLGFGFFVILIPQSWWLYIILSLIYGKITYVMFLVENVFLVAIGFKTVPLYRAAYTTGLILLLITAFVCFDSWYSFKFPFWINLIGVGVLSWLMFWYQFWAVTIELPDDGKTKSRLTYVYIPTWLMMNLALVFSFWPVGIFKGSVYLMSIIYVLGGLIQADIRERLFRKTVNQYLFIFISWLLAIVFLTRWK